jgi:hypothetical protein
MPAVRLPDNEEVTSTAQLASLEAHLEPLRQRLTEHPLYASIRTLQHVRLFMESHVYAVWDFMSLLKALQRTLTCVDVPWVPTSYAASRRFVNEIVLGEESDVYEGRPMSHFELYLEAMRQAGADTSAMQATLAGCSDGALRLEQASPAARAFVESTFAVIASGSPVACAAAFTFGREDAIPEMFRRFVRQLDQGTDGRLTTFAWYLERHIEVDGEDHGPLALQMMADLCGGAPERWEEARDAAASALLARIALWDGILDQIHSSAAA